MNYETFPAHPDLESIVKCYWILEVPAEAGAERQRIIPDGCLEMVFILGDDIKRYTHNDEFILQPRAMVLGQITEPFFVQPTGYVHSFAVRFYPYGFANFVTTSIKDLANKETPIEQLFGIDDAQTLTDKIIQAADTKARIEIAEEFLLARLRNQSTIDSIVRSTIDAMLSTKGTVPIKKILESDLSKRRQLERNFIKQIGISPKQLGKVIRMQAALKMLLNREAENLTEIAYESEYYDQSHFIKDFKSFTGINPAEFLGSNQMTLSSLFYKKS